MLAGLTPMVVVLLLLCGTLLRSQYRLLLLLHVVRLILRSCYGSGCLKRCCKLSARAAGWLVTGPKCSPHSTEQLL
jgi:hypothetical protein